MSDQVNLRGLLALKLLDDEFDFESASGDVLDSYRARSLDNDTSLIETRVKEASEAFWAETVNINKNLKEFRSGEASEVNYLSSRAGGQLIKRLTPEVANESQGGNRYVFNQGEADVWMKGLLDQAKGHKGYVRNGLVSITKAIDSEISKAVRDEGQKRLTMRQPSMTEDEEYGVVLDVLQNRHGMSDSNVDFFLYLDSMKKVLSNK